MRGEKAHLHLMHPVLDSWVTVEIHERDGRYMATADLGEDCRDVGVGDTPQEVVRAALRSLGEPYAGEMAAGIEGVRGNRRRPAAPPPRAAEAVPETCLSVMTATTSLWTQMRA